MLPDSLNARFVSFAQNNEDVILWRALRAIGRGFYIDVGAYSPDDDSVTRAFYDRGWNGINVEPNPDCFEAFASGRPRDINLNFAAGDRITDLTLFVVGSNPGLSTLNETEAAERMREGLTIKASPVHIETLASIADAHVLQDQEVHFLKVDVEGFEREVLAGNDWHRHRPWIVVVEATRPQTTEPTHDRWEAVLRRARYDFVYFDGLNRFYLADEHLELRAAFGSPPNVFDNFIRASEVRAEDRARAGEERAAAMEAQLDAIQASRSWRLTGPLRAFSSSIRRRSHSGT